MSDPHDSNGPEAGADPLDIRLARARTDAAIRADRLAMLDAPLREALLCDEILALRAELDGARADMAALRASRSWRLTAPVRALARGLTRRG